MHDKKRIAWKESVSSTWIVLTDLISHGFVCELHGFPSFPHLKITTTSRCHSNSLKDEEWLVLATKNFSFLVKILHSKSLRIRNKYDKTHTSYQKKKKFSQLIVAISTCQEWKVKQFLTPINESPPHLVGIQPGHHWHLSSWSSVEWTTWCIHLSPTLETSNGRRYTTSG